MALMPEQAPPAICLMGPWPPPYGGVSVFVQRLQSLLRRDQYDVRVLGYGDFEPVRGLARLPLMKEPWKLSLLRILWSSRTGRVLHDNSGLLSYPVEHVARGYVGALMRRGTPWVLNLHDSTLPVRFEAFNESIKREYPSLISSADHVIATEAHIRDFIVDLGVPANRTSVIPPFVPTADDPTAPPRAVADFARAHSPLFITTGASVPVYDLLTAVRAFERVLDQYPSAGLLVVKTGFAADSDYSRQVDECLSRIGNRAFVVRDLPNPEFTACLRLADVFFRGLDAVDSFGLSRLEAILAAVPTVATRSRETAGTFFYDYGDSRSAVSAMIDALNAGPTPDLGSASRRYTAIAEENLEAIKMVYSQAARRKREWHGHGS